MAGKIRSFHTESLSDPNRSIVIFSDEDGDLRSATCDGTIVIEIPDFLSTREDGRPSLPVRRSWVEVLAGRKVSLVSAETFDEDVKPELLGIFNLLGDPALTIR